MPGFLPIILVGLFFFFPCVRDFFFECLFWASLIFIHLFFQQIAFAAKEVDFSEWKGDILVVIVSEKDMSKNENSKFTTTALRRLDGVLGGVLGEASAEEDFTGKAGQSMVLRLSNSGFKRIGLFGLGQCTPSAAAIVYRGLGEVIAGVVKAVQASNVAVLPVSFEGSEESKTIIASAIASGIYI